MSIYTKFGDNGQTRTVDNQIVAKESAVIEANGTIDELNCHIGLIRAKIATPGIAQWLFNSMGKPNGLDVMTTIDLLFEIQNKLFEIGSIISCREIVMICEKFMFLSENDVEKLEKSIDECDKMLPKLTKFILPHGNEVVCEIHVARAVCRRAERTIRPVFQFDNKPKPLSLGEEITQEQYESAMEQLNLCQKYMNRLSDWLFVFARCAAHLSNCGEKYWEGKHD